MFGSAILEIGIGLILVFLLFSLIVTATCEAAQLLMKSRARELERGLAEVFQDREGGEVRTAFYNHPLLYALYRGPYTPRNFGAQDSSGSMLGKMGERSHTGRDLPSYIPKSQFSTVIYDLWQSGAVNATVQNALGVLAQQSDGDPASIRAKIEAWYDAAMERVSGTYKRYAQQFSFVIGFLIAAALNLNALAIVEALSTNATLRAAMLATAEGFVAQAAEQAKEKDAEPPVPESQAEAGGEATPADDAGSPVAEGAAPPSEESDEPAAAGLPVTKDAGAAAVAEEEVEIPVGYVALYSAIKDAGIPMGWTANVPAIWVETGNEVDPWDFQGKVFGWMLAGWLIMALAGTLGAPFWFDLLNKFVTIRSTMKPQDAPPSQTPPPAPQSSVPADVPDDAAVDLPSGPTPDNVSPYQYG